MREGKDSCRELGALYAREDAFRSRVIMQRHSFGRGEYKYLRYQLPRGVEGLRQAIYPRLAPIADRWNEAMGVSVRYPAEHEAFLARCHEAGQSRPTPLLLRYGPGDYNRLHQDLYGAVYFPFQLVILLSQPQADFDGGEFVLTERRARMQTRADVVPLSKGEGVIFSTRERPVPSARGVSRAEFRHGVSRIRNGERYTLGIVFHDAA